MFDFCRHFLFCGFRPSLTNLILLPSSVPCLRVNGFAQASVQTFDYFKLNVAASLSGTFTYLKEISQRNILLNYSWDEDSRDWKRFDCTRK